MKQFLLAVLLLVFVGGITGCVTISGGEFDYARTDNVTVGMQGQEVKNILGEPYSIERYSEGEKWIWSYATRKDIYSFVVSVEDGYVRSLSKFRDVK